MMTGSFQLPFAAGASGVMGASLALRRVRFLRGGSLSSVSSGWRFRFGSGGRSDGGAAYSASRRALFAAREFFSRSAAASRSRRSFRLGAAASGGSALTVSASSESKLSPVISGAGSKS